MSDRDTKELGKLLQDYARACYGDIPDRREAERLGARLDRTLSHRVEVLGMDVERLLAVDTDQVLVELEALEREAAMEDASTRSTAAGVRAREEVHFHDQTNATRRDHRMRPGGHRQSAPHGRRDQRG